jgi:putative sigma-54 modulation protein
MYSSIDMALAKMERQVRRYKDRITQHKPHKGKAARVRQIVISAEAFEESEPMAAADERRSAEAEPAQAPGPAPETPAAKIVREKEYRAERLTVNEAVMQLNLMHKQFLVFTNTETGDINVIYRTEDGDYGLIETRGHVEDA